MFVPQYKKNSLKNAYTKHVQLGVSIPKRWGSQMPEELWCLVLEYVQELEVVHVSYGIRSVFHCRLYYDIIGMDTKKFGQDGARYDVAVNFNGHFRVRFSAAIDQFYDSMKSTMQYFYNNFDVINIYDYYNALTQIVSVNKQLHDDLMYGIGRDFKHFSRSVKEDDFFTYFNCTDSFRYLEIVYDNGIMEGYKWYDEMYMNVSEGAGTLYTTQGDVYVHELPFIN
jgi:hypothetical protein